MSTAAILAALLVCGSERVLANDADKADQKLQSVQDKIKRQEAESERQKKRALQLKSEMASISNELVQAAQRVHDQEASVAGVEAELNKLERAAKLKEQKLRERQRQFSGVMMALTRIAPSSHQKTDAGVHAVFVLSALPHVRAY